MARFRLSLLIALVTTPLLIGSPATAQDLARCPGDHADFGTACVIGTPNAQGITLRDAFNSPGQVRAYRFRVEPGPSASYIYVGDLWHAVDVAVWRDSAEAEPARGTLLTEARTFELRDIQFVRPQTVVQQLEPGTYTVLIRAPDEAGMALSRGFTLRVALGPPVCASQRDAADRYQLALTYQPTDSTSFSLLSFTAFVVPPYSDLFEFDWQIDGASVPGRPREIAQIAASDLGDGASNEHRVRVTARGVRAYPDPDPRFRHVPPTLTVECTFRIS
jgi:hypothetical protein